MIIVIDTREQQPYRFSESVMTRRMTLPVGDYTLLGFEDQIVIERKSLNDLLGSITHHRDRFVRELRQLRAFRFAALVIEACWPDLIDRRYDRAVHPNAVIGSLMSFTIKYGVVPVLVDDHRTGAAVTERMLHNFSRMIEKDFGQLNMEVHPNGYAPHPPVSG